MDYSKYSKEELEIFCHNKDYEIERNRNKILLLTGCVAFGDTDGMNGTCVDCSYEDPVLWERCSSFKFAFKKYLDRINARKLGDKDV